MCHNGSLMTPEKEELYEKDGRAPDPIEVDDDNRVYEDLITVYNLLGKTMQDESERLGVPARSMAALVRLVSSGRAFDIDGRLLISFSPEIFHRFWGKENLEEFGAYFKFEVGHPGAKDLYSPRRNGQFMPFHQVPDQEWRAFNTAEGLNHDAAIKATSMGLGQIMGFNYKLAGFESPSAMFEQMQVSVRAQVSGLVNFVGAHDQLVTALKNNDYKAFCQVYFNHAEAEVLARRMSRLSEAYRMLTGRRALKAF